METGNTCRKQPARSGDEVDAIWSKNLLYWKAGERKSLKRAINRRERRLVRKVLAALRGMWYE